MNRSRLLLVALWLALGLGLGTAFFFYMGESTRTMGREVALAMLDTLAQTELNLRTPLESVSSLSAFLVANPGIREVLESDSDPAAPLAMYEDYKKLSRLLASLPTRQEITKVRFFVEDRFSYSREHENFFGLSMAKDTPWYRPVVDRAGGAYITSQGSTVTVYRQVGIGTPGPGEAFPILAVDIPGTLFSQILTQSPLARNNRILLLDAQLKVLASAQAEEWGKPVGSVLTEIDPEIDLEGLLRSPSGMAEVRGRGKTITVLHRSLGVPDWTLVTAIDTPKLLGATSAYAVTLALAVIVLVTTGLLLSALLVASIITEGTTRKLRDISRAINAAGPAYFEETNAPGDLNHLEAAVAHLVETTRTLMDDAYRAKEREQAARFSALQAQINPHFLYNTLDSINWMAHRSGANDIVDLVQALARYFRFSLGHGEEIVTVANELELIRAYLVVQRARFGPIFEAAIEVPDELLPLAIPKLSLQPLVENALLHGLQHRRGGVGRLSVTGYRHGSEVRFAVADNGMGMSAERLSEVRSGLATSHELPRKNFGLWNVSERLHLYFRSGGLDFESEQGSGTTVTLRFEARGGPDQVTS